MEPPKAEGTASTKRVQPTRVRRGGPGIGSCEADVMILDAMKRRAENEPMIAPGFNFLLTTDSRLVPRSQSFSASASTSTTVGPGNPSPKRYFDQPLVVSAMKKQQEILVPEFSLLSEDGTVGGRFRPRSLGEESADTSDAVYEKRHRKYETFERRQRLREKEKLKHEQYKLKERIEQLRAMDSSSFMTLSPSSFSTLNSHRDQALTEEGNSEASSPHNEGEQRRKEMLRVALTLEDRYRILLPPDRKYLERDKQSIEATSTNASVEPELESENPSRKGRHKRRWESGSQGEVAENERTNVTEKIKLKIRFPARTVSDFKVASAESSKYNDVRQVKDSPSTRYSKRFAGKAAVRSPSLPLTDHAAHHSSCESEDLRELLDPLSRSSSPIATDDEGEVQRNGSSPHRPKKRPKVRLSLSRHGSQEISSAYHPLSERAYTSSTLVQSAIRTSNTPTARKTQRHLTGFGIKVPPELDEVREYRLPEWIHPGDGPHGANIPIKVVGGGVQEPYNLPVSHMD